jgi:hypothetical protein
VLIDELLPPLVKGLFAAGLLAAVMSTVEAALNALLVRITNRSVPTEYEVSGDESKSRDELECEVVEDLVERDARYRPAAGDWTEAILTVKRMSLEGTSPEGIIDYLESRGS